VIAVHLSVEMQLRYPECMAAPLPPGIAMSSVKDIGVLDVKDIGV